MRRPKALLPWYQQFLFEHLAQQLGAVCAEVLLVGDDHPEYRGYSVLPDAFASIGPLGGIASALRYRPEAVGAGGEWRVILSCDCPLVNATLLSRLVGETEAGNAAAGFDAVVPETPDGNLHPLCAVWRQTLAKPLFRQIETHLADSNAARSGLGVQRFLRSQRLRVLPGFDAWQLSNVNSMREYLAALSGRPLT